MNKFSSILFTTTILSMMVGCKQQEQPEPVPSQPRDKETVLAYGGEYRKASSIHFVNQYTIPISTPILEAFRPDYEDFYQTVLEESGWIGGPPLEAPRKIQYANQPSIYAHFQLFPPTDRVEKREWSKAYAKEYFDPKSKEGESTNFKQIAELYGDTGFNDSFWSEQSFIKGRLMSMTLTCNSDFDDEHPAGASLNDIALIIYYTAEPFIKSGYNDLKTGVVRSGTKIDKLENFSKKKLDLLLENFVIGIIKNPKVEGNYTYKLKYQFENADEMSIDIDHYSLWPISDENQ